MTPQSHDRPARPGSPAAAGRHRRQALTAVAAAGTCALLAAACGSTAAPGSAASSASSPVPASAASAAKVALSVTFSGSASTAPAHFTLRCEPAGGSVADPATACQKLMSGTSIFAPRPAHIMCPMIMADAGHASVTGTYLGRKVHVTVVDGGCDLSRWSKLKSVFN